MMAFLIDDDLPELKPCPFCGRNPAMQEDIRYPRPECKAVKAYEVVCNTYGCVIYHADNVYFESPLEAAKKWNRRTNDATD